jgi:hypothetical protein
MARTKPPSSREDRNPSWPWGVFGAIVVGSIVVDATTAWQHGSGVTLPYDYWVEGTVVALAYGLVGAVICARVRGNLLGPIMLATGVLGVVQGLAGTAAISGIHLGWPTWAVDTAGGVFGAVQARGVGLVALVLMLAPTGRPLTPRWRWPIVAYLGLLVVGAAATLFVGPDPNSLDGYPQGRGIPPPFGQDFLASLGVTIGTYGLLAGIAVGCLCLALRWFRSQGLARQQVTWVVLGGLAGPALVLVDLVITLSWTGSTQTPGLHGSLVWAAAGATLPIGIAIAVLRHGLYELDRVISRTVSYALVTGGLITIYAVTVTATSRLLPVSSSFAVAAATLAAAAAFQPLLSRVRNAVDRRFDRTSYDAAATVDAFAQELGRQVELASIATSLEVAVRDTVRPTQVSLWLRSR